MKKILSIFLALTLIIGLIPTAFADDTVAETVTYSFTNNQHGEEELPYLEKLDGLKKTGDSVLGGSWAYLGTTSTRTYGDGGKYFFALDSEKACISFSPDSFAAFKIKVTKTAKYEISEYIARLWKSKSGARDVKIYIVPFTENLAADSSVWGQVTGTARTGAATFTSLNLTAEPLGTLYHDILTANVEVSDYNSHIDLSDFEAIDLVANTEYALIFYSPGGGHFAPASLTLTEIIPEPVASFASETYETYNEGTVQLDAKLVAADGVTDITADATSVEYESNNTAIATVDANGSVTGVSEGTAVITATYTYNGKEYTDSATISVTEVNKTHEYLFMLSKVTKEALAEAGITKVVDGDTVTYEKNGEKVKNLADLSVISEYSDIDDTKKWCIATDLSNCTMDLHTGSWRVTGEKENYLSDNDGSFATLKLKVDFTGTYKIEARVIEADTGAETDVYLIPVTADVKKITQAYLKTLVPSCKINGVGKQDEYKTVGTTYIKEGEYYVVFNMNTDNSNTINGKQNLNLRRIKLTESTGTTTDTNAPAEKEVSAPTIAITSNLPDAKIDVTTLDYVGASYTLNAPDEEGYTFLGWKRGVAEKNGESYIETNGTSKFTDYKQNDIINVYTNTFLTAVYEKNEPAATENPMIKFWNQDKSFLGAIAKNEITALPKVSLIGHDFTGWFTSPGKELDLDDVTVDTNAVAGYEEKSYIDADNEYDTVRVNGKNASASKYGEAVACEDNDGTVTHWLRDGKIVSYDKKYTHYVWDGTVISSSYAPVEKKPLVVLEKTTIDGASMIEYDGAGKQIVEVGILFGEVNSTPVVGSTFDKYVSQRSDNHGQLAAKPINDSYTVARGYMIYIDGGKTYVIYSE